MNSIIRSIAFGTAIASLGIAAGASAATTDSAEVAAEILTSLSVAVDPTDDTLDFGTVSPGATAVSLVVGPDGTLTGGCPSGAACGGTTNAPTFTIDGLSGALVNVSFANSSETLTSAGGDTMNVGAFTTSLTGNQATLNGSGEASFTVGGTLAVAVAQAPGTYSGSLTVNVAYN